MDFYYNKITFYIRAESDFVFIGYSNGILRVHSLAKESIPRNDGMLSWSTENYWTISLHSPTGGSIREIYTIETQQDHLLVCCGQDGGIFAHKINQALDSVYQKTMDEKVCCICLASYSLNLKTSFKNYNGRVWHSYLYSFSPSKMRLISSPPKVLNLKKFSKAQGQDCLVRKGSQRFLAGEMRLWQQIFQVKR